MLNLTKCAFGLLWLCLTSAAWAAPEISGNIEAVVDGKKITFPLLKSDIQAKVKGDLVTVTVKQTFENPSTQPLNATYLFPLNQNAAVHQMVMEVGDERIKTNAAAFSVCK